MSIRRYRSDDLQTGIRVRRPCRNVRRIACAKSGFAITTADTDSYLYNTRSELTNATAAVDALYRYGYAFDDIGNRKTSAGRGINSVYTASQLNQYTAVDDFIPVYDADGNQTIVKTATGIWQVIYNGENRPVRWENGDSVITMSYDRMGRRVTKNDQRFVYNGYLQIANFHSTTTTSDYNYFVWDPTEPVATRPLVWTKNHISSYYAFDGNKNVSEVLAADGSVSAHYEYAPFGALTVSRGESAATNPWRFSSEYAEDDTATVYYNYRHYEPVMGRWLSLDKRSDTPNLYSMCSNAYGILDILGLYRMLSGYLFDKKSTPGEGALRSKIINEIYYINYIMKPNCYTVLLKDLEFATVETINSIAQQKNTTVLIIAHGNSESKYVLRNGTTIDPKLLAVDAENEFGCYISPRVRNENEKDTYEDMFTAFLGRLIQLTPEVETCCEMKRIVIFEGEATGTLFTKGSAAAGFKWNTVDEEIAKQRESERVEDLQNYENHEEYHPKK